MRKKLAPLCVEMRANVGHQKRIRPNVLTKHQYRARGNPPNRIFATAGHCSFAPKCVSKGLLPETVRASFGAACIQSRICAERGGFDFAIPRISESVTRTKQNLPNIYIYMYETCKAVYIYILHIFDALQLLCTCDELQPLPGLVSSVLLAANNPRVGMDVASPADPWVSTLWECGFGRLA